MWDRTANRVAAVLLAAAGIVALIVWVVFAYLRSSPPTVSFTGAQGPVHMTIQTVGAIGYGVHPTWVSYLVQDPHTGKWVHTTIWQLPADREVDVTVYQYDSGSGFRNPIWDGVTGTTGNVATFNGKQESVIDASSGSGVGHSFNVPDLGINVPLIGVPSTAQNTCSGAPCDPSSAHNTVTFSFHTPPGAGNYRWQCFIPCGLAFLYGNGGPMSETGYMGGFLQVVPA